MGLPSFSGMGDEYGKENKFRSTPYVVSDGGAERHEGGDIEMKCSSTNFPSMLGALGEARSNFLYLLCCL